MGIEPTPTTRQMGPVPPSQRFAHKHVASALFVHVKENFTFKMPNGLTVISYTP